MQNAKCPMPKVFTPGDRDRFRHLAFDNWHFALIHADLVHAQRQMTLIPLSILARNEEARTPKDDAAGGLFERADGDDDALDEIARRLEARDFRGPDRRGDGGRFVEIPPRRLAVD